jgi:hypothetical protein
MPIGSHLAMVVTLRLLHLSLFADPMINLSVR